MRVGAQVISWVFVPLLMPLYALLVAMYIPSVEVSFFQENTLYWMNPTYKVLILSMFLIFSFLAPGISLVMLKKSKAISSLEVDDQSERRMPIIISALYCLLLAILLWVKTPEQLLPASIYALPWGGFIGITLAGIINRFEKISLHALGAGMLLGYFVPYYYYQAEFYFEILIVSVLICGLIMSARLYLGKHSLKQIIMGFGTGFVSVFLCVILFYRFC